MPVSKIAPIPNQAADGIPPVINTAVQSTTVWMISDTNVAVKGVEYRMPCLTVTLATAKEKAVSQAKNCGDIFRENEG